MTEWNLSRYLNPRKLSLWHSQSHFAGHPTVKAVRQVFVRKGQRIKDITKAKQRKAQFQFIDAGAAHGRAAAPPRALNIYPRYGEESTSGPSQTPHKRPRSLLHTKIYGKMIAHQNRLPLKPLQSSVHMLGAEEDFNMARNPFCIFTPWNPRCHPPKPPGPPPGRPRPPWSPWPPKPPWSAWPPKPPWTPGPPKPPRPHKPPGPPWR